MFCARHGLSEPTGHCQDGYHCPSGATSPDGTGNMVYNQFCLQLDSLCVYKGFNSFKMCDFQMESTGNNMCPAGHYCPAGISSPLPCPAGTFSSSPGLSGAEQCQPCPPGYFCEQTALIHPSEATLCDAG